MIQSNMNKNNFKEVDFDAVVVGAGFGGLYSVHKLRNELGLNVRAYDNGSDVGGTWYWNRYPGALSDTESFLYPLSFDKELLEEGDWKHNYLTQPEILSYLNKVADRFDLRRSYQFNTKVTSTYFNEEHNYWEVTTDKGETVTAKFLVTGLGLLSATNVPNFKGIETFKGEQYHTARWPQDVDLKGKRVGIIGTGSTGVQVIIDIAPKVEHLTVFQRTPQYSVPIGLKVQSDAEKAEIKANYEEIWKQAKSSAVAFGFEESTVPAVSVSKEEQERVFEEAWNIGGGFRFMFGTFSDIATNPEANEAAANFIRKKIQEIVKDPETARKLTPTGLYAKRPLCDNGYYDTYNRDNVSLVSVKETPIVEVTPKGVRTTDSEYELDVLIFATGFDAVDGNYTKIDMRGRDGITMKEKWADGPTGYLGMMNTHFPNHFMILGPNGPFTNLPPSIETQVEWISDTVKYMVENDISTIEPKQEAEDEWITTCQTISDQTLFSKGESWIFGANIPGKKNTVMFYLGGLGNYRKALEELGFKGFIFDRVASVANVK
ncbi:NAD(P)/FAD-dependent oxidoreductase [Niallia oryzisoli]|uniref:NAD(P)/FAD-dependent oxidoreductase n=1 Tax=Niallia oryzisoli TaxID=1737571 RepID=A0ABZ2CIM3_9BACI